MLSTWLTERFGLTVPVVSAPMGGVSNGAFAAAVSAAGALGTIGFTGRDPEVLRQEAKVAAGGGRPFGIGLLAWAQPHTPGVLDAAIEAGPALISVSFGDYADAVARIRAAGIVAATQVATAAEARAAEAAGVDVVIARGLEGGGHGRDALGTLVVLQAVLDAVDLPVLAAGGIATRRGLAAVLAAGAAGAWVGSAFLSCVEGAHSDEYRGAVVAAGDTDTVYTTVLDIGRGIPWPSPYGGRAIRNEFATTWHGREQELAASGTRSDEPAYWAGQSVTLIDRERTVGEVVDELRRAEELLRRFG